jgi:hypothetical protein
VNDLEVEKVLEYLHVFQERYLQVFQMLKRKKYQNKDEGDFLSLAYMLAGLVPQSDC